MNTNSLKAKLLAAELGLTEADFGSHESDLYVLAKPGVYEWLKANHEFACNIQFFTGAKGSDWEGQQALDIPFANQDYWDALA